MGRAILTSWCESTPYRLPQGTKVLLVSGGRKATHPTWSKSDTGTSPSGLQLNPLHPWGHFPHYLESRETHCFETSRECFRHTPKPSLPTRFLGLKSKGSEIFGKKENGWYNYIMEQTFDKLAKELDELRFLEDGWNSYDAQAPSIDSILRAKSILDALESECMVPRRVMASAEGGVAIVFLPSNTNRAMIEVLNNQETFFILYNLNGDPSTIEWSESCKSEQFNELRRHLEGVFLAT